MTPGVTYLLMRRYGWTAAEVAALPEWMIPMLLTEPRA